MKKHSVNGKGDKWRKNFNYKKYRESLFWLSIDETKNKSKKSIENLDTNHINIRE